MRPETTGPFRDEPYDQERDPVYGPAARAAQAAQGAQAPRTEQAPAPAPGPATDAVSAPAQCVSAPAQAVSAPAQGVSAPTQAVPTPVPSAEPDASPPASAEPAPESVRDVPLLGPPRFSGAKAPLYAPNPAAAVAAGPDTEAALVPDTVLDGATAGRLTVRAGSVRGDAHRYHAEPRQDSLAVARLGGPDHELLLLAVADGVGSARRSHAGSRIVCHEIVRQLEPLAGHLADFLRRGEDKELTGLVNSAVGSAAESLAQSAAGLGHRPDDYATTLRVLLVPVDPAVRTRAFFAVGDGGTLRLREGGWVPLFPEEEQSGSGAGIIDTRTAALPSTRYAQVRLIHDALPGDVIVLCTDGVSNPLAGDGEMREFLRDSWAGGPPGLADFLWQLQYRVKSYDDDRTAVCLWEEESA